jgi:hypothetical protein
VNLCDSFGVILDNSQTFVGGGIQSRGRYNLPMLAAIQSSRYIKLSLGLNFIMLLMSFVSVAFFNFFNPFTWRAFLIFGVIVIALFFISIITSIVFVFLSKVELRYRFIPFAANVSMFVLFPFVQYVTINSPLESPRAELSEQCLLYKVYKHEASQLSDDEINDLALTGASIENPSDEEWTRFAAYMHVLEERNGMYSMDEWDECE